MLGLFYALRLGNCIHSTFIFTFMYSYFLREFSSLFFFAHCPIIYEYFLFYLFSIAYQPLWVIQCLNHPYKRTILFYLTNILEDKRIHSFPSGITRKVNIIARLELKCFSPAHQPLWYEDSSQIIFNWSKTLGQSTLWRNCNKSVFHTPQSYRTVASPSDAV